MMNNKRRGNTGPQNKYVPRGRFCLFLAAASLVSVPAFGQKLYLETFDSAPLGPNPEEASKGANVWTKTPPAGWAVDDTGMPGFGTPEYPANDGRTEWAGWAFADVRWWPTVDNQRRAEFLRSTGVAAIADPDEWDDATHLKGHFNSYLTSPEINVAGKAANSLVLTFDSSWRPEGFDDGGTNWPVDDQGQPTNNQTAVITAQWDGGTPVEVLRWDSDNSDRAEGDFFKADAVNEAALAELNNPGNAQKLVLKFGLINGANDWWWAIDNVAVGEPPLVIGAQATGVSVAVQVREALGKTVNDNAAITAKLDGQTIAVTDARDPELNDIVVVTHDQSPKIFTPRASHTVEVTFTTGDGRTVTDTATFIGPSYVTASATPVAVTAAIAEKDYLTVDTTKGVQVEIDGTAVTGATVNRVDLVGTDGSDIPDRIDVRYQVATPWAAGSTHSIKLTFTTATAQTVSETVNFTVPAYVTLPAALATAAGTGADAGMRWKTHQLAAARPAENLATANRQLLGELGASVHDPSAQNAQGYFDITYVNFDRFASDAGNFNASSQVEGQAVGDDYIPGIPGLEGGTENLVGEALAYIEIPAAGIYSMVVNSDDGFGVYVGNATNPSFLELGKFDAGRGQADTQFYFRADQAGVYLFRLLYFQGGGDGRVEWFTVNPNGTRALVGGDQTGALRAYKRRTVAEPNLPTTTPTLGIARQAGNVVLTYTGTLQSADSAAGPYAPVAGATSPFTVTPTGGQKFYRAGQ